MDNNTRTQLSRIERKIDRILAILAQRSVDATITRLHNQARRLQRQCDTEKRQILDLLKHGSDDNR